MTQRAFTPAVKLAEVAAEVGQRLRVARLARGLSLKTLAPMMGTDHASLSRMERGLQPITAPHLVAAARVLHLPVAALVGEVQPEHAPALAALRDGGVAGAAVLARIVAELLAGETTP